jgi:cytochrome c-type biogenesis protein CcmH
MHVFFIVAAAMAVIAAATVAAPLLRDRRNRLIGAVAALVVVGAAAGFYRLWSTWDWNAPMQTRAEAPEIAAMVAKLESRLREQPNDLQGWLMLGRSYEALQRLDDAIAAYDHAHRLDSTSPEATLGLGEAISLRNGGEITPAAADLFEDALRHAPDNPKALLYGGFAAAVRGDNGLARSRWESLKRLHPPPQIEQMLDARIADLEQPSGGPADAGAVPGGAAASGAAGAADAHATVNISLAPALKSRLHGDAALFVFAREPGSRGPPLAAKRLSSAALGSQVQLSGADSMLPGHALADGQHVSITARISFSGQPTPATGDLYGELTYEVGHDGVRDLVIDKIAD